MRALNDYLFKLWKSPVPPVHVSQVGGEYVSVTVRNLDEHWESRFYPNGDIDVSFYVTSEYHDGVDALSLILGPLGKTWHPLPKGSTPLAAAVAFTELLRQADVAHDFCLGTCSGGVIVAVSLPHEHWEVTFEDADDDDPESTTKSISAERFEHVPEADMTGEDALDATLEWWERLDADDPTDVRVEAPPAIAVPDSI